MSISRSTIKPNPLLELYLIVLLPQGIVVALILLYTVLNVVDIIVERSAAHVVNAFTIGLPVFVLMVVSTFLQYRYWKHIERRRQGAAEEDHACLAEEQPTPDVGAMVLPAIFKISMSKAQILFLTVFMELLMIVVSSVYGWFIITVIPFWLLLVGGMALALILVWFLVATSRQVLEVTEVGLRLGASRSSGFCGMVRWNEAHLFAVYKAPSVWRRGAVLTYELSSASSIVCWTRVLRPSSFGLHMESGMSLDEHNQAMESLSQLIVAQTGLLLYDLSKEHTVKVREGTTSY